jgi:4-amino-4-deoxy-L-arabinose transferase-like glycosyltransferase
LVVLVFAVAAFLLFFRLGAGSLHSWTEAIYAEIGKEILSTGDWNTLHHNGKPYLKKPPLFMWLTALSYKAQGISEFSARFFSPLFALGIFLFVYLLGRRMGAWPVGLGAILILLHGVRDWHYAHRSNFLALCRTSNIDIPLTFFIACAMYLLWKGREKRSALIWMGIPLGLGIMTKSAVGLLPFLMAFLFVFFTRKRISWSYRHLALGFALGLLIAAPWHVGQLLLHGKHFWNSYISTTVVARVGHYMTRTKGETYYLTVLRKGFGLSVYLLPLAVLYALYRGIKKREDSAILLLIWALLPLFLFSLSRDKNGWYIAQIYPALALLLAQFLWGILKRPPWAFALAVSLIFLMSLRFPPPADPSREIKTLAPCIQERVRPEETLYEYGVRFDVPLPSLVFYADRLVRSAGKRPLSEALAKEGRFLVTTTNYWKPETRRGRLICQSGTWVLLRTEGPEKGEIRHSRAEEGGKPSFPQRTEDGESSSETE